MKKYFLFFLTSIIFSCSTQSVSYNRDKILKKYSDYKFYVDGLKSDLGTLYLDKNNIKSIVVDKKNKNLNINQNKKVEFFELKNLNLDILSSGRRTFDKNKIGHIVVDGILLTDSLKKEIKIDPNAIKSLSILSHDKLNSIVSCRTHDKDFLVITTQ